MPTKKKNIGVEMAAEINADQFAYLRGYVREIEKITRV